MAQCMKRLLMSTVPAIVGAAATAGWAEKVEWPEGVARQSAFPTPTAATTQRSDAADGQVAVPLPAVRFEAPGRGAIGGRRP